MTHRIKRTVRSGEGKYEAIKENSLFALFINVVYFISAGRGEEKLDLFESNQLISSESTCSSYSA